MKPSQPATQPLNTVQTILSPSSVSYLECVLRWLWDEVDQECFTDLVMSMFAAYIKVCPEDVHPTRQPDYMAAGFVADLIRLNEQLAEIVREERVWDWADTMTGWGKPVE